MTQRARRGRRNPHPDPMRIFRAGRSGQNRPRGRASARFRSESENRDRRNSHDDVRQPDKFERTGGRGSASTFCRKSLRHRHSANGALERGTEFRQNHFGIRQERGRRTRLPYFGGGIHSAPHPSCSHRSRVIAKTNVGKSLKVVSLSRIIPFFSAIGAMGDFRDESKR